MAFVLMVKGLVMTSLLALMIPTVTVTASDGEAYVVETVLDGNKLDLAVYSVAEVGDGGSVVALDVAKSSLLRFRLPLSQGSESMERIAGSLEGKAGYRDGHADEALFNRPKNLAVDDDGNIYIADPKNLAIRKLSKSGFVTTIAGGSNKTGHADGEGQEATFSNDFAVTYVRSCCCLLVTDHGNRMVRQIQLPQVDGHCPRSIPKAPGNNIRDITLCLTFVGVGVVLTIIAFKGWSMGRHFRSTAPASMVTRVHPQETWPLPSSIQQQMSNEQPTATMFFVIQNAAAEFFIRGIWLEIAEGVLQLFAYVVLHIISFPLQLLSMCTTTSPNPMPQPPLTPKVDQGETDLLGLGITTTLHGPKQLNYNHQVHGGLTSRRKSSSQPRGTFMTAGSGSAVLPKDISPVNPWLKMSSNANTQLGDLIDFSEPGASIRDHQQFSLI